MHNIVQIDDMVARHCSVQGTQPPRPLSEYLDADVPAQGTDTEEGQPMGDHVYKKIELVGSSSTSIDDAIQNAVGTASDTLDHVNWFEVKEIRGDVVDGQIDYYQVVLKIGFRLDRGA